MRTISRTAFTTVKTEGAILPADLLQRIADGRGLEGLRPEDYHLLPGERLNEAVNRAWNRCIGAWSAFQDGRARLPDSDLGTTLTRERWLLILLQELGYGRLTYQGSLPLGPSDDAPRYAISHAWGHAPIHLVTFRQDLDRRDPASRRSPHSLVQEYLNRAEDSLWGLVSNGLRLRVLRDNASLTRAAYVEFDLEAMFDGELYADFALLWLVCHQSRVEAVPASACWLEKWFQASAAQGVRALETLRQGVQQAIAALGRGFLANPSNRALRDALRDNALSGQDYYRQLLRLVYRLIFLLVAEERDLLLVPGTPAETRRRYAEHYSVRRLRDLAETLRGGPHADLYRALRLMLVLLRQGFPALGLPALGSYLFSDRATPDLDGADLSNAALLQAIRALCFTEDGGVRRAVDYQNLGAEELGSVYESLLELHPHLHIDAGAFDLEVAAGSERKTTGSYYTPTSLIDCLLDSALEPVVQDRLNDVKRDNGKRRAEASPAPRFASAEEAILSLRVVDPACGSGHFLIAAAHRLARHLARARTGDEEPAPAEERAALRDVVRHCIHGVDINPMAVELCKVALWMETIDPGKPLSFLDRNIQCGNSLIGATPALLRDGIPDEAFTPIEGDDKAYCSEWRKQNKKQRGQGTLFALDLQPWERLGDLATGMMGLDSESEDTLDAVQRKQERYEALVRSSGYRYGRLLADAWCAAFVWKKTKEFAYPITEEVFRRVQHNPYDVAPWMAEEIERLREQYQFFHWHLAFPHVFRVPGRDETPENEGAGWNGGFDVVLGNPPWERVKLQEEEWFAAKRPEIAQAPKAADRRRLIEALRKDDSGLFAAFLEDRRQAEGESAFARVSGRYPLCGRGDVNTYAVFSELSRTLQSTGGRVGIIVESAIATGDTTKDFFRDLMDSHTLVSLYDFENREGLFPGAHREMKFCLLTLSSTPFESQTGTQFVFFAHRVEDLRDPERRFALTSDDMALLNPNTRTCPILRSKRDAELTKAIYRRVPVLVNEDTGENPWGIRFAAMFHMTNDSGLFRTREHLEAQGFVPESNQFKRGEETYLPLYEGKLTQIFDHRSATFAGVPPDEVAKGNPRDLTEAEHQMAEVTAIPRFWVARRAFLTALPSGSVNTFWLTFHGIANPNNERTFVATVCPATPAGNSMPIVFCEQDSLALTMVVALAPNLNSVPFDYMSRLKIGTRNVNFFVVKQLSALPPDVYAAQCGWNPAATLLHWLRPRVLELTYTAWDLQPFARDCGYNGPPFRWDEERRFLLRCELDAAYFHLYGIARDDVEYIMDTFPIVRRKDEAAHGEYRTKRVILEIYDAMQRAMNTGEPYQTRLDPPPADPRVAHPAKE